MLFSSIPFLYYFLPLLLAVYFLAPKRAKNLVLLVASLFFFLASAIGLLRLPDFYSRLHASGNSETLGLMLACLGLVIYEGPNLLSVKMIIVFLLVFLANPIGTHILGKAALKSGHPVWTLEDKEEE